MARPELDATSFADVFEGTTQWSATVDVPCGWSEPLRVDFEIDVGPSGPTNEQIVLANAIVERFASLWKSIIDAFVESCDFLETDVDFVRFLGEPVIVNVPLDPGPRSKWTVQVGFRLKSQADMSYFADIEDWQVALVDGVG